MNRTGIGLLGCGQIARQRYLPLLRGRQDAEVVAVCTSRVDTAREAAARIGTSVDWMTDVRQLIEHPRVDAIIISTPHRQHALQAAAALDAGKHVLLEKPMATCWDDAEKLIRAAQRSGAVAMILPYEHNAELQAMASCLEPGIMGRIVSITADFSGPGAAPGDAWKYSMAESGGGVIVAHAVYALDLLASIMGPAAKVTAFSNTFLPERSVPGGDPVRSDIEDNAVILLEYESGQLATIRSCWSYPHKQRHLVIQGSRRRLIMASGAVYLTPPGDPAGGTAVADPVYFPKQRLMRVPLPRDVDNIVDHFLRAVRTGTRPAANIDQAAHVTEQMMKAYESIRTGAAQTLSTAFVPRLSPGSELLRN